MIIKFPVGFLFVSHRLLLSLLIPNIRFNMYVCVAIIHSAAQAQRMEINFFFDFLFVKVFCEDAFFVI